MPSSNYTQTGFLGGEWSPLSQGRTDQPAYRQALNWCQNAWPVEEGAWQRRPGFIDLGITHLGYDGIVRAFTAGDFEVNGINTKWEVEITSNGSTSYCRLWIPSAQSLLPRLLADSTETVHAISTANPAVIQLSNAVSWATGDTIYMILTAESGATLNATLTGRQFLITKIDTTHFSLQDAQTGANVDGAGLTFTADSAVAYRIYVGSLPYGSVAEVKRVRVLQNGNSMLLLEKGYSPRLLTINPSTLAVTIADADFKEADGPYLDPGPGSGQDGFETATTTTSDGITFRVTPAASTFAATDVGRCFRMWSQPAAWAAGTYTTNDTVTYNGVYWTCTAAGTTAIPGQPQVVSGVQTFPWQLTPDLGRWTSAYVTAVAGDLSYVDVHISFNENAYPLDRATLDRWQIGLYTAGQYPTCGVWYEGRLYLGGAVHNRFDAGMAGAWDSFVAGDTPLFSYTDKHDVVLDSSAIAETFYAPENSEILWMAEDKQGVLFSTVGGQWLVGASTLADPITPTSIQTKQVTHFKAAFIDPLRVGTCLVFIQAARRRVYEYIVDAFSGRFTARPLNELARHLTDDMLGIRETAFQEDPLPMIWAVSAYDLAGTDVPAGDLLACTYRRVSNFATEPPVFNGWHWHSHGAGRIFTSICMASLDNGLDAPMTITKDSNGVHRIEILSKVWGAAEGSV